MLKSERRSGQTLKMLIAAQIAVASSCMLIGTADAQQISKSDHFDLAAETKSAETTKEAAPSRAPRPHIDLAFCIDTTGSMQGEIDEVKTKVKEIVAKLSGGKPSPVIRVGLVAFRDRSDEYVTKVFPFTEDIDRVVKDISDLKAQGGGDAPEAVAHGLHSSVHELKWDKNSKTLKLLFVIGDAGPNKSDKFDWKQEAKDAIAGGIQINTIGCDGLQRFAAAEGSEVFQEIAKLADGKFEFLSYRSEVANKDGSHSTIVHAAGKAYKMKASDATAWRAGAKNLEAKGMASEVAAAPSGALAGHVFGGLTRSSRGRAAYTPPTDASMGVAGAGGGGGAASDEGASYGSFSRRENNLADMVLGATKQAADKKLQVKFDTK